MPTELEKAKEEAKRLLEDARIQAEAILETARSAASLTLEKLRVAERLVAVETTLADLNRQKVQVINYLINEFGGDDPVTGNRIEGNTVKKLNEISGRVAIQNGRVAKLESWRSWATGGAAVLGILFVAVVTACAEVLMKGSGGK